MRRPKAQPKETHVPRLRNARVDRLREESARAHKSPGLPAARLSRERSFRLRNVKRD